MAHTIWWAQQSKNIREGNRKARIRRAQPIWGASSVVTAPRRTLSFDWALKINDSRHSALARSWCSDPSSLVSNMATFPPTDKDEPNKWTSVTDFQPSARRVAKECLMVNACNSLSEDMVAVSERLSSIVPLSCRLLGKDLTADAHNIWTTSRNDYSSTNANGKAASSIMTSNASSSSLTCAFVKAGTTYPLTPELPRRAFNRSVCWVASMFKRSS